MPDPLIRPRFRLAFPRRTIAVLGPLLVTVWLTSRQSVEHLLGTMASPYGTLTGPTTADLKITRTRISTTRARMEAADRRSPCDPESRRMNTWEYTASPEGPGWRDLSNWLLVDRGLQWTAFDRWVSARDESCDATPYIAQLEGPTGLTVGTRSFEALALKVLQLIDGVIVGWDAQPPQRESNDVRAIAAAAVEAIDGAWWRVYARDERRLNELFARFPGALKLDPLTPMPAVHRES